MKTSDLLLSGLNITEDNYSFRGLFILGDSKRIRHCDMSELDNEKKLLEIKSYFDLDENTDIIKATLMEMIFEKANISSIIKEGLTSE